MAIVIGPTPPGTGVIHAARSAASSNATSPTSRYPFSVESSSTRFTPTSITTAPSRTQSPRTISARPTATMRISPWRVIAGRSRVRLCATVTVAFAQGSFWSRIMARGIPTTFDRPTITTCRPVGSTPVCLISSWMPAGVAERNAVGSPPAMRPTLIGWNPSTSFVGRIRSIAARSSR